jgi:antitoxin component YwqK of YwqJK toxin-antitoxin module
MNEVKFGRRIWRRIRPQICWRNVAYWASGMLLWFSQGLAFAQSTDPYRAELLPIQSGGPKSQDAFSTPASPETAAPRRLAIPTLNVSSSGTTVQQGTSDENLPKQKQDPGTTSDQDQVDNPGIVRMLKPLVIEPQNRELLTQRYPNGQVMIEREVAMDQHGNYLNDGQWKMYDLDQQLMGSGRFENGQMVGLWRRTHLEPDHPWLSSAEFRGFRAPFHSSAEFVDGKLHGLWLIKDDQERKVVELNYRAGRRHGTGTWWHANGEVRRRLTFQEDLLHGSWQEWNAESRLLTENWFVAGQRIDKQTNNFADDRPESEVSFLEAKLTLVGEDDWWNARLASYQPSGERIQTGPVKAWYDNGQRHMAGYYKDGQRHGEFAWWHANGHRKMMATYDKGQQVGKWIWWHENGIKAAEGSYANNQAIGQWTAWNEAGEITRQRDLGSERESVARPNYDPADEAAIEELPPQLEQENLNAPLTPSFDQLDLPPPVSVENKTETTTPTAEPEKNPETPAANTPPVDSPKQDSQPPVEPEENLPQPRPAQDSNGGAPGSGTGTDPNSDAGAGTPPTADVEKLELGGL